MIKKTATAIAAALVLPLLGGLFSNDFAEKPELTIQSRPDSGNGDITYLSTFLPLEDTRGEDFALEVNFAIDTFNHYAVFALALTDEKENCKVELKFSKGDDRVQRCEFTIQEAPGTVALLPAFEQVETGVMKLQISYNRAKEQLTIVLRDADGDKLCETKHLLTSKVAFDRLRLAVNNRDGSDSAIIWMADPGHIAFRAQVGAEGWYAYLIEGRLNSISLKTR